MALPTSDDLFGLVEELFPLCRSITGNGVRETLTRIKKDIPLILHEIPTGTNCFDWKIPKEWNIRDAYVKDASGKKIIDFQKSNLHVVSYSIPFKGKISLAELKNHLHSLPQRPKAIPYVTSYYKETWGFCLPHEQLLSLKDGEYEVLIDSDLKKGSLTYADLVIPGERKEEILLTTYVCHPSMVINELSGPVVATFLAKYLLEKKHRKYTYRFVFAPETIGTIAYLSQNLKTLQRNVIAGYVLTCLAGNKSFTYLETRGNDSLVDRLTKNILKHSGVPFKILPFTERGSDERQYGWPGVDIPVASIMKSSYQDFPTYHSSDDNLENSSGEELLESLNLYRSCIEAFECNDTPLVTTTCEPFLSGRGLYRSLSTREYSLDSKLLFNVLGHSDGKQDIVTLADKLEVSLFKIAEIVKHCESHGLLVTGSALSKASRSKKRSSRPHATA